MPYKDPHSPAAKASQKRRTKKWLNTPKGKRTRKRVDKKYHLKIRMKVLIHYGGDPPKCVCCGEDHIEFLTIDHIAGGGRQHLKKIGCYGSAFYRWLIKNNFPKGFQVLCWNCNCAKGHYGYCPHKK